MELQAFYFQLAFAATSKITSATFDG